MLIAGIDMRLSTDTHDPVKVVDIHVDKNSVQPRQDLLALWLKTLWERNICCDREELKGLQI